MRLRSSGIPSINLKADATGVSSGAGCQLDGSFLVAAMANDTDFLGVAEGDIAASAFGPVGIVGVVRATAAAGFNGAPGGHVAPADATTFDGGTATNPSAGRIVNSDPASGGLLDFVMTSVIFGQPAIP